MISITNMFSTNRHNHHSSCLTVAYRTQSSQRPETSSCLPKTEAFPSSFRYAREACDGDYHLNISNSNSMNHQYAPVSLKISSQKNNEHSEMRCVVTVSNNTRQYYARVQNACLQVVGRQGAFQNFESFLLSPKSYFEEI